MSNLLHLARCVLLSPELITALLLVALWFVFPLPFVWLDEASADLTWLLIGPFGAFALTSVGLCWQILFPKANATALTRWPAYPKLRITSLVGVSFVVVGGVVAAAGVIGRGALPEGVTALLLVCGYLVAAIAVLTMLAAALTVRSIMVGGN